jgi:hypothetical protein
MKRNLTILVLATNAALLCLPISSQAITFQFNAALNGASQVPATGVLGTGVATLFYNDNNSAITTDDTYSFSLTASGLSGAVTGMHIHGPAAVGASAAIIVPLTTPTFLSLSSGSSLLIGGTNVTPPSTSFLSQLQSGLTYVNLHTALNPAGEIRGQLLPVVTAAAVPEPSSYAMMLAGLGIISFLVRKRT